MSDTFTPRFLRREWKRYKPHLPKSTSLPELQLRPVNRPLFTCDRCSFSNTLIPLCLWCEWTSDAARLQFDRPIIRARRMSAPAVVSCNIRRPSSDDFTVLRPKSPTRSRRSAHFWSHLSISKLLPPVTARIRLSWSKASDCYDGDGQRNAATDIPSHDNEGELNRPASATSRHAPQPVHSTASAIESRPQPPRPELIIPSTPNNSGTGSASDRCMAAPPPEPEHFPLPHRLDTLPSPVSPPRTLRRKKRMLTQRQRSTTSLRSRASAPPAPLTDAAPLRPQSCFSEGAIPPPVRLGHPSRPYYTAIRKNMALPPPSASRPTSTLYGASTPRPTSALYGEPTSRPASTLYDAPASPVRLSVDSAAGPFLPPALGAGMGYSLSGETELRIALAGEQHAGYRFQRTGKTGVGGKVKRLSQGFKDLVRRKSDD